MYTVPAGAILELTLRARLNDQVIMMVRHYQRSLAEQDDLPNGALAANMIATAWDPAQTGITALYGSITTTEMIFESIRAQWINPQRYAYIQVGCDTPAGVLTPPAVQQNQTMVITLRSELGGRHGVGGVFITGLKATNLNSGFWSQGSINDAGSLGSFLTQPLSYNPDMARQMIPVIYRRSVPISSANVDTLVIQPEVRTMRRRTVGRGI